MLRERVLAVSLALGLGAAAFAPAPARAGEEPPRERLSQEEMGDLRETVHMVMLSRLKRTLALSEEQERRVVPLLDELGGARQQFRRDSRSGLDEVRRLLESGSASEPEYDAAVRRVRDTRRRFEGERQRLEQEVERALSSEQRARLLVFMQDFRKEMRQRFERAQRQGSARRGPGRGRPLPAPPADDPGDEDW